MRRLVFPIIVGLGFVMIGSSSASAEDPTPAPTVSAKATPGKKLCKVTDPKLDEISGLVATKNGYVVIDDGTTDESKKKIFFLDSQCAVDKVQEFSGDGPKDPEDLVLSADGDTLWIADIGDGGIRSGDEPRPTIALWSMPVSGAKKPTIHRLSYPSGDAHDAEAMLLDGDGTPLIITKEIGATAGVYKPTAPLKAKNDTGVPMERVADLPINATETAGNPVARIGNKTITGGAVAPGGGKVVLRTYTDALEWDVAGGDVVAALKKEPRTTGLPNEPFGEAITYSSDGSTFLTVSDMNGDKETANNIRQYTPATTVAKLSEKSGDDQAGDPWYLDVDNLTYAVAGVGGFGLILVAIGVFGIVRFRKSPQAVSANVDDAPSGGLRPNPDNELIGVGGARPGGPVYGGARSGNGPVYGAQSGPAAGSARPGGGGPVYGGAPGGAQGGAPGGGPQYGRPQQPRGPQGQPARGPQQAPARGPQGQPARGPQQAPGRGPQGQPPRGPQGQPPHGPQQQPPRNPQQPPPGRGGVYGGGGGQQQRGPQQGQRPPGVYGGGGRPHPEGHDNNNGYR
ncbi:hypothetical protein AB0M02_05165 [Actinoplanes sp. NPDC051861]|uniref:hypothetical protein n=1 Tax=Actinoplanes sp. NPDC051861 TaxID=3155170 RepID=UPI00342E9BC0